MMVCTCHGESCQGVDDARKEQVVDLVLELERLLRHEDVAVEDEQRVEDGEGEKKLVEEALLHHGRDRHERYQVAQESENSDHADRDSGKPEPGLLDEGVGSGAVTAKLVPIVKNFFGCN